MYYISINSQFLPSLKIGHGTTTSQIWCKIHSGNCAHTSILAATEVTTHCPAMNTLTQ